MFARARTWRPAATVIIILTEDFALGGASGDYGGEDKLITVESAGAKALPVISIVPDTFDAPYGRVKNKDRSGHNKAIHLPLGATCVQEKGALLALLDIDTTKAKGPTTSVATNVLLPALADQIVLDGASVSLDKPTEIPARVGGVLGVRKGKAGVAFRVFAADGEAASAFLRADADGLQAGVARLAVYHHRGPAQIMPANPSVKVGVLILAARCTDEAAFAALLKRAAETKIEARTEGATWSVSATIAPDLALSAARDVDKNRVLYRRVTWATRPIPWRGR